MVERKAINCGKKRSVVAMAVFYCISDRRGRIGTVAAQNPIGIVLPAIPGISNDNGRFAWSRAAEAFVYDVSRESGIKSHDFFRCHKSVIGEDGPRH